MTNYPVRSSQLGLLQVITIASAGMIQIGDRQKTDSLTRALAVQRAEDHWSAGNVYFESYPFFTRPFPILRDEEYETGNTIVTSRKNREQLIQVGSIRIIASGSAASIMIGNGKQLVSNSRIKHIRQFPYPTIKSKNQPQ